MTYFIFIRNCGLYNYTGENTKINVLEYENKVLIDWFSFNCMQANPNDFQTIAEGKRTHEESPVFSFESININKREDLQK